MSSNCFLQVGQLQLYTVEKTGMVYKNIPSIITVQLEALQ